ncbi:hypothetical protein HMPREF9120_00082 [Neisseria sp. oral taxon 020 str. F0370]|nr:hypothetical protein HMPREF9120_00082 [Neisseria sp. oral taxon 020 str. F0370]
MHGSICSSANYLPLPTLPALGRRGGSLVHGGFSVSETSFPPLRLGADKGEKGRLKP